MYRNVVPRHQINTTITNVPQKNLEVGSLGERVVTRGSILTLMQREPERRFQKLESMTANSLRECHLMPRSHKRVRNDAHRARDVRRNSCISTLLHLFTSRSPLTLRRFIITSIRNLAKLPAAGIAYTEIEVQTTRVVRRQTHEFTHR